jgi:hypothetical protein
MPGDRALGVSIRRSRSSPCLDFRMEGLEELPLALVQNLIEDGSGKLGRHVGPDVAEIVLQARFLLVQFIVRRFMIGAENSRLLLNFESLGYAQL